MIKSAEPYSLFSLLGLPVCSWGTSHVFSFVKKAVNLKGAGNSTLLKWIVMYAWQTLIMRLASGRIKEEMLEIREELIRSYFYDYIHSYHGFLKLCFPFHYLNCLTALIL